MEEILHRQSHSFDVENSRIHIISTISNGNTTPSIASLAPAQIYSIPFHHNGNAHQFKQYCSTIGEMLQKVHGHQLVQLKNKYRFHLNKVEKLEKIKAQLEEKFSMLDQIVNQSAPVRQETNSINFIRMISSQTQRKLDILQGKVTKQKQNKKGSMKKIQSLKQKIRKQKDQFFELKRLGLKIRTQLQSQEKANKLQSANLTFLNIVNNKVMKKKLNVLGKVDERSDSNQHLENDNKQMNVAQISCRFSNLQLIQNKLLKQELSSNECLTNYLKERNSQQLPTIQNQIKQRQSLGEISLLKDRNREARNSGCTYDCKENMAINQSEGCDFYERNQQNKIKSVMANQSKLEMKNSNHEHAKVKIVSNKREKIMVAQLNKVQKMKQQLVKQAEKGKNEKKIMQSYPVKSGSVSNKSSLCKSNILEPLEKLVKYHKSICKNEQKQCVACQKKQDKFKISQQKFSLHRTDITKLKQKLQNFAQRKSNKRPENIKSDHRNFQSMQNWVRHGTESDTNQKIVKDSLISGDETLLVINEQREAKEAFLNLSCEQILKKIVESNKMGEILRLMQKQNVWKIKKNVMGKVL